MRLPRITLRRLMLAVAVVALALSPRVIGPGPNESNSVDWVVGMAVTSIPPILIMPCLFRLSRSRRPLVIVASAGIAIAQLILRVPPNLYAVDSYMAMAGIARLARDDRDFHSAILAVTCGVLVGLACGYNPCVPIDIARLRTLSRLLGGIA